MKFTLALMVLVLVSTPLVSADNKGWCPPPPPAAAFKSAKKIAAQQQKNQQQDTGSVVLLATISDTGHVCSAHIVQGVNKNVDANAVKTILAWRFTPAKKDGRPVPVAVTIKVDYHLNPNGNVIVSRPGIPQPSGSSSH